MSNIIMFFHYLFFITCGESVLRELRCALVEIQSKTGPVTVKVNQLPHFVAVTSECVLRELRCALVEIQSKTGPVTVKVNQLPHFVAVTGGIVSPLHDLQTLDNIYNSQIDFNISQVLPTQVPPLGGCYIWGPMN
ncbi:hypothetical protein HZH68_016564 [Vespula germanica]|uniref:Uncharacterized protein n=1 Tax=Vespula germanica TaxID=30212 RepID=A0A834J1M4_VESGE|nr:hypothetical protein HZH68_016564 [Vespula germanica]